MAADAIDRSCRRMHGTCQRSTDTRIDTRPTISDIGVNASRRFNATESGEGCISRRGIEFPIPGSERKRQEIESRLPDKVA